MAGMQTLVNGRWVDSNTLEAQQYVREMEAAAAARKAAEESRFDSRLSDISKIADPFQGERSQYQSQLRDLMTNPAGAIDSNPFFKANMAAGEDAAMRRLRKLGMGGSGNAALELQQNAMANQSGNFFKLADLLGGFSGAQTNPAAGANAQMEMLRFNESNRRYNQQNNQQPVSVYGGMTTPSSGVNNYWTSGQWNNSPFFQEQRQNDANAQAKRDYYEKYGGFAP